MRKNLQRTMKDPDTTLTLEEEKLLTESYHDQATGKLLTAEELKKRL